MNSTNLSTLPKIAFIGGGNMACAIINGLLADGCDAYSVSVWGRDKEKTAALGNKLGINAYTGLNAGGINETLISHDIWLLCVKPNLISMICKNIRAHWQAAVKKGKPPLIVSVAAGVTLTSISKWIVGEQETSSSPKVVRVMPNTAATVGKSISGACMTKYCTDDDKQLVNRIFQAVGEVLWVDDEALIHAITAISGSGIAYYFYFTECLAKAGMAFGLDEKTAQFLARQTLIGAGYLTNNSLESLSTLRSHVTGKGGTTEKAILAFSESLPKIVELAAKAAHDRSIAISLPVED